jgi:hypothetical protein
MMKKLQLLAFFAGLLTAVSVLADEMPSQDPYPQQPAPYGDSTPYPTPFQQPDDGQPQPPPQPTVEQPQNQQNGLPPTDTTQPSNL